uniref:Uncharacterized protein n=1 Tax=Anguilla anguilla TaxID=7936 RepID=A0A0E9SBI8_ANGAN
MRRLVVSFNCRCTEISSHSCSMFLIFG